MDKDNFVIDVAKEHKYQNQDDNYRKAYTRWRSDKDNPYTYTFVQDTREHSYMAGKGFIKVNAHDAENSTLYKCLSLLGVVMIIHLAFDVLIYAVMRSFNLMQGNVVYFSQRFTEQHSQLLHVVVFIALTVVKYLTIILVYKFKTKVPLEVALPKTRANPVMDFNSVVIMLMIMVVGRLCSTLLDKIMAVFNVDSVYIYMFPDTNAAVMMASAVLNCLIIPVFIEVFFRGFVMQSFRQFGDSFAVIVASIACCLTFYDLSYIGYSMCCSIVIGLFTIRTGSLRTAVYMHVISTAVNYLLTLVGVFSNTTGRLLEITVYMLICASALVVYSRLNNNKNWTYNIDLQSSDLPFDKKLEQVFSSNTIVLWFVLVIILTIVGMKIL